jgi:hypothetical protein
MTDDNDAQSSAKSDKESNKGPGNASKKESAEKMESSSETELAPEPAPKPESEQSLREPFPFARLFLTIVFGVIASIAFWLFVVLALLQFVTIAIAGQKNEELQYFSRRMGRFIQEVFDYITLASDTQPFPLGPFPKE